MNIDTPQPLSPSEEGELGQHAERHDMGAKRTDEVSRCPACAPSSKYVVDYKHVVFGGGGVTVDFNAICAVLQVVHLVVHVMWKFAWLSHGYEPGSKAYGDWSSKDEAARFYAHDFCNPAITKRFDHRIESLVEDLVVAK